MNRHRWHGVLRRPGDDVHNRCLHCGMLRKIASGTRTVWRYQFRCGRWFYSESVPSCPAVCKHNCLGEPQCKAAA